MHFVKDKNPEQSIIRRVQKLRRERRIYASPWFHTIWHVDGYDKHKPYWTFVQGCIDEFWEKFL